jgi:hypothetical protein
VRFSSVEGGWPFFERGLCFPLAGVFFLWLNRYL